MPSVPAVLAGTGGGRGGEILKIGMPFGTFWFNLEPSLQEMRNIDSPFNVLCNRLV